MITDSYFSHPLLREVSFMIPPLFQWRRKATRMVIELAKYVDTPKRILEIGCASGFLSKRIAQIFPESEVYGIDTSSRMIDFARKRNPYPNLVFLNNDYLEIEEKFDLIVALYVFNFIPKERVFGKLRDTLTPNGNALIAFTSPTPITKIHKRLYEFVGVFNYLLSPDEYIEELHRIGLKGRVFPINSPEGSILVLVSNKKSKMKYQKSNTKFEIRISKQIQISNFK